MDNSVCFEKFKDYLTNVKKASSNTLSSYLRDIRQFGEYLDSHETVGYTEADEEVLNGYISWLRGKIGSDRFPLHRVAEMLLYLPHSPAHRERKPDRQAGSG